MLEPDSTLVLSMVAVPIQAALQMHSYWCTQMDNRQFILGYVTLPFPELKSLTLFPKLWSWYGIWFMVNEKRAQVGAARHQDGQGKEKIKAVFSFSWSSVYGSSCTSKSVLVTVICICGFQFTVLCIVSLLISLTRALCNKLN